MNPTTPSSARKSLFTSTPPAAEEGSSPIFRSIMNPTTLSPARKSLFTSTPPAAEEGSSPVFRSIMNPSTPSPARKPLFTSTPPAAEEGPSQPKTPRKSCNSIDDFSKNMSNYKDDVDTKLKAVLYSLMVDDVKGAEDDLTRLRRTSCAFFSQSSFILKNLQKNAAQTQQRLTTTEAYNLYLHRENNELRDKIRHLQQELASKDAELAAEMFNKDFDEEEKEEKSDVASKDPEGASQMLDNDFEGEGIAEEKSEKENK